MSRLSTLAVVVAVLLVSHSHLRTAQAAECHGAPKPDAQPNMNAIETGEPVHVRDVPNGKLFHVGTGDDTIALVHL